MSGKGDEKQNGEMGFISCGCDFFLFLEWQTGKGIVQRGAMILSEGITKIAANE